MVMNSQNNIARDGRDLCTCAHNRLTDVCMFHDHHLRYFCDKAVPAVTTANTISYMEVISEQILRLADHIRKRKFPYNLLI